MRRKRLTIKLVWRLSIALILAICPVGSFNSSPVLAQEVFNYFTFTYDVELSQTVVEGTDTFSATIEGETTCINELPVGGAILEASIIGRVKARHNTSGAEVVLNSGYTVTVSPFPDEPDESTTGSATAQLQFPAGSQTGTYSVTAECVEAKLHIVDPFGWVDFTSWLPATKPVGTVTLTPVDTGGSGGGGGGGGGGGWWCRYYPGKGLHNYNWQIH